MFNSPKSAFEIEVPEPLHVFKNRRVHPDNEQLLLSAQDNRLLTKSKIKTYQERLSVLTWILDHCGYQAIQAEIEQLSIPYNEIRIQIHELRLKAVDQEYLEAWVTRLEAEMLLKKSRGLIRQYRQLQQQLNQPVNPSGKIKGLAKKIVESGISLRKASRQAQYIKQRLEEHSEAVRQQKHREKLCQEMAKEAKLFGRIIQDRWAALGFCHRYTINRGKRPKIITQKVGFSRIEATEDELHFKIDVTSLGIWGETHNQMPNGVPVGKLLTQEVMDDLTVACQRQVSTPHHEEGANYVNGAWVTVNRLGATDGLMDYVELKQVMTTYKRDWQTEIPVPMGVKRGRLVNWVRLSKQPHLLVAGQTGAGKSNVFNVFITTIFKMHSPDEVRLILADLKEGIGFLKYQGSQHLLGDVITEVDQLLAILQRLEMLRKQRTVQIRALADNIDDYNRMVSPDNRLPRIILLCDEFQEAGATNKETRQAVHKLTHQLAAKGRNAGIHLFLGTQIGYADMLPGPIKGNITFVLSGRQRTIGASISSFGNKQASELPKIPGRMLCDDGNDQYPVQIPYCTGSDITEALEASANWDAPRPLELPSLETDESGEPIVKVFDQNTLIRYALQQLEGNLNGKDVWEYTRREFGLSRDKTYEMINQIIEGFQHTGCIELDGVSYGLIKHKRHYQLVKSEFTEVPNITFSEN